MWTLLLIIISGDNSSMRFLILFDFCQSKKLYRFRAAEAVLSTIFERSQLIFSKEIGCLIFPKSFPDYKTIKNVRTQLIEDIQLSLKRLDSSQCSKQVKQQIMSVFEPLKGIQWKYMRALGQQNRSQLGINKNSQYAFYLNSTLMSFVIRLLYQRDDNGMFQSAIGYSRKVNYLVGTPGLGKSSKLIAIKHLHDLRIPYIISHEDQMPTFKLQSKFVIHYKFVYIISDYSLEEIQETIEKQLVMDFGKIPSQIQKLRKLTNENSFSYFKGVYNLYRSKGISLKLIVDQVSVLYDMLYSNDLQNYHQFINPITKLSGCSYSPSILVSSKNNDLYHKNQLDPIIKISRSTQNNIKYTKFIIDNYISAEERLISSVECLLFELEKHEVKRSTAIKIIQQVEIGFKTHLDIATAVQKAQKAVSKVISTDEEIQTWVENLNQLFAFQSMDKTKFLANIQNARQAFLNMELSPRESFINKTKLQGNILFWINVLLESFYFTVKVGPVKEISVKINLKCDNGSTEIEKKAVVLRRDITQNDQFLSQINFFFSYKEQLYFCYSPADLQSLKFELVKHVDIPLLRKLSLLNKKVIDKFAGSNFGYVFEILICNFYEQPIGNSFSSFASVSTQIHNIEFEHRITSSISVVQKFDVKKIDFADMLKKLMISHNYFRTEVRHKSIDFVLSQYQQEKLKLVLVDTTKSVYDKFIAEKTINFKAKLLSDKQFDSFVNSLCSSQQIKELEIVYYVLMSDQTNNSKLYDPNCIEEVEENFFDAVKNQISVLEVRQHQIQIGLQIQKHKTEQGIIQSSIDNKVTKPAQLTENSANAKNQLEQIQKWIRKLETRIKQLEKKTKQLESKVKLYKRSVGAIEKFKENRKVPVEVTVAVGVYNKHFVIKSEIKDQMKTRKDTFVVEIMQLVKELTKKELSDNELN